MNEYLNHLKFIEESDHIKQYYNFSEYRLDPKGRTKKIIFKMMGTKGYGRTIWVTLKIKESLC